MRSHQLLETAASIRAREVEPCLLLGPGEHLSGLELGPQAPRVRAETERALQLCACVLDHLQQRGPRRPTLDHFLE